ncbi:MAG: 30S ribosomal protein S8 [Candidatus Micrarchaeota archaeon]|nr:30S ribosomal protein S8 [Candidatus Micrarchaeota archaeon]
MAVDLFAEGINTIKINELDGKKVCKVKCTKLLVEVLKVLLRYDYIKSFEIINNGRYKEIVVHLNGQINNFGVIKPRFSARKDNLHEWEQVYIPAVDFGILILSTSQGVMSNREARERGVGGRLLAYVY